MKTTYNTYDGILSRSYKKEQNEKLNIRIKNAKSLINNNCPETFNIFRKRQNKSNINNLSKNLYLIFRQKLYNKTRKYDNISKITRY